MEQKFRDYVKELMKQNEIISKTLESNEFEEDVRKALIGSYNTRLNIIKDLEKILEQK